jgi:vacuolar-type H+-ATPase subunit E/Vma4
VREAGIHAIIHKIRADAEEHGNECFTRIKSDSDRDFVRERDFLAGDYEKRRDILQNHNKHEYDLLIDRMKNRYSRELLTYRRVLIDGIFDRAAAKLRDVSEEELGNMLVSAVAGLKGDFTLRVGEHSAGRLSAAKIGEAIGRGEGLSITLHPEAINDKSGFVLNDGRVEYNCLFEDLIEDMKGLKMNAIMGEVFGDFI